MKKYIKISMLTALVAATGMSASGQVRWDGAGGDGMWTNAANWFQAGTDPLLRYVPTLTNDVANWTGQAVTIDTSAEVFRFWARHASGDNLLNIVTNGSLTAAQDVALVEFAGSVQSAELQVNGGSMVVSNNLSVAGQATSQGSGSLFLNSGTIDVFNNVRIGTLGQQAGVTGELTVNGGVLTVQNRTIVGGGNLASDAGTLVINGGQYIEDGSANTNGAAFAIGAGPGSGTVEMNGGVLINNNALEMNVASNDTGSAAIDFNGGEFWQLDPNVAVQGDSTLNFTEGVLYWSSNQVAALDGLVANSNVTYVLGLTNMLTESWDAAWTNGFTLDYGYWSKSYGSALYADVDDVTNGFTTVWAMNLSPDVLPPETDGLITTYTFNNASGDQVWTTPGNWSPASVPTGEDTVNHTSVPDVLVVDNDVAVSNMTVSLSTTSAVSAVTFGSLDVNGSLTLGGGGAAGLLLADGGDITVDGVLLGGTGVSGRGLIELNSGTITVNDNTVLGDWNTDSSGILTVNGGTYTQANGEIALGTRAGTGSGTLVINGGEVLIPNSNSAWDPLRIANGAGSGTVIINDGLLSVKGMEMDWQGGADSTFGAIYLNGGEFRINGSFGAAGRIADNSFIQIDGGVFKWSGAAQVATVTNYIDQGFITWTNGSNTMLSEEPIASYTNGLSSLHVDVIDGFTTVWAFVPPPPENPPAMAIAVGAGSVEVSVENLDAFKGYELKGTDSLVFTNWVGLGSTSGVLEATWTIPTTEAVQFFQVEEQTP